MILASGMGLFPYDPAPGALVSDTLSLGAVVISSVQLASVVVSVAGSFDSLIPFPDQQHGVNNWVGVINLVGLLAGDKTLTFTARNISGDSVQKSYLIHLNPLPVIQIVAPLPYTVARPDLAINLSCQDDQGCDSVIAYVSEPVNGAVEVARGQTQINTTVSLANWDGKPVTFSVLAWDHTGGHVVRSRVLFVESNAALLETGAVPGRILDVAADRILYLDSLLPLPGLKTWDRVNGTYVVRNLPPGTQIEAAFLAPGGAVYVDHQSSQPVAYQWQGSLVSTLTTSTTGLKVVGEWAIWLNSIGQLQRADLLTGAVITIDDHLTPGSPDLAPNGDIVYSRNPPLPPDTTSPGIYRFRASVRTHLTDTTGINPRTDGSRIVFQSSVLPYRIILLDGPNQTVLSTWPTPPSAAAGSEYQVTGGWVAFIRPSSGNQTVLWTHSPADVEQQASFLGNPAFLEAVGPAGEVVFQPTTGTIPPRYLATPPYGPSPGTIGSGALGRPILLNGQLSIVIGRSVFQVVP